MNASITADSPLLSPANGSRSRRYGLAVTLVSLLVVGALVLFALDRLLSPAEFHIEKVRVSGAVEQVDATEVEKRIWQTLRGNYFALDLERLEAAVETLPWVYGAAVRRRWPGSLLVEVDEVQPVAKWGDGRWLNVTGDLVQLPDGTELEALPRLSGQTGEEAKLWSRFRAWQGLMVANGAVLRTLELDERGTWTLRFGLSPLAASLAPAAKDTESLSSKEAAEGQAAKAAGAPAVQPDTKREVKIVARSEEVDRQLARFVKALKFTFLDQLEQIDYVDLRYPNGFAIRWREPIGDAQEKAD
ncbi:MAG: FtsQ-type POTRA domain-containing protein [Pseudomonadota bacterium]|nr:FtsQ-type POTRA domain-containing protein [Pseudomonadota bacterium]